MKTMKPTHFNEASGKRTSIIVFALCVIVIISSSLLSAQSKTKRAALAYFKPTLNVFSFNDLLLAKKTTLPDMLDWAAKQNIDAIDVTGYYFPGYPEVPSDEYIYNFKRKAHELGIEISGTGIRNNFASPDPAVRAADVELAKKWIVVASKLGAPVIRLFAGAIPAGYENKWDEVAGWMIECYKECAVYGEKYGVLIGIQNHGDMLQTADQCIKIIKAVNSGWVGLIVDTGNFKTADPYKDIEAVVPYAVNWQVKDNLTVAGNRVATDYPRLMKILKNGGYRGYLPVETLPIKGTSYDPYALVPQMLKDLRAARDAEFNN